MGETPTLNTIVEKKCDRCSPNEDWYHSMVTKITIPDTLWYFVILIEQKCPDGNGQLHKSYKQLQGFKATDQRLFNKTFEAVAAIRHVGDSLEAGHYKTMGRFDRKWV